LAEDPQDVDALIARGFAYYALRDFHRGEADVAKALELAPKNPRAWRARGRGLNARNKFDEAIAAFDRAIELGNSDPSLFVERAMTFDMAGDRVEAIKELDKEIERHPENAEAFSCRAELLRVSDQWNRARADYQKALELEPKKLVYRVIRANAYFERDDFDRGLADVLEAMRLNPGDVGVDYQPSSAKELSKEALRHGEQQVRRMLRDRPAMAQHVTPGDKLWTWAVRKFAGEDLGSLVDWDSGSPEPFAARSSPPHGSYHGSIQVATESPQNEPGQDWGFHELWCSAVFELYNVTSGRHFEEVDSRRDAGTISREEYVVAMLNVEELATQKCRAFYVKFAVPWFKSKKVPLGAPHVWGCTSFNTSGDPTTELAAWGADPRIPWYEARFDVAQARLAYLRGELSAARALIEPVLAQEESLASDNLHDALDMLGCIQLMEENVEAAIVAFDRAIQIAPDNVRKCVSLYLKGDAELSRWNFDRAIEEYTAAIQTDPLCVDALMRRAWAYSQRQKLDAAIKDVDAAIKLQPQEASLYVYRGNFWIDKRDYARAVEDFTKAIEVAPDSGDGYRGRANANYDRGDTDAALADWDAAIARKSDDYAIFIERGSLHQAKGNFKQAWDDYSAAITLEPEQPEGYAFRAELTLLDDAREYFRPDEAFADAKRACKITEWKSAKELALLATACAAKQEFAEAVKWQQKALENADPLVRRQALTDLEQYRRRLQAARKK